MLPRMGFQPKRAFLPSDNELPPWAMSLGLAVAVGVIYFLAARLSLALISRPDGVAVFWPAAGVSSGVLIGLGPAARLPVIVGTVAATIVANMLGDRSFWSSLVFALCNAGEAVVVALLIQRFFGSPFRLESVKRVFGLVAAAIVATALSGTVATFAYKTLYASPAPVLTIWRTWFVSDALGIITIAPLLIGVFSAVRDRPPPREALEGFLALVCVAALAVLILRLPSEAWAVEVIIALFFPLSLWIAARCQPAFAAAAVSIIAITVVWSTTYGTGVFGNPALPVRERVLTAQAIILATTLGALILAALFAERRRHEAIVVENAERLQSALQIGGVMAFSWWVREGTTQRSENAAQMMGYDPDQPIPADSFLERIHPEDRERFKAYLHDVSPENPSYVVAFRYHAARRAGGLVRGNRAGRIRCRPPRGEDDGADPRCHRAQARRGRARGLAQGGRDRRPGQIRVPRRGEPRPAPAAAEPDTAHQRAEAAPADRRRTSAASAASRARSM